MLVNPGLNLPGSPDLSTVVTQVPNSLCCLLEFHPCPVDELFGALEDPPTPPVNMLWWQWHLPWIGGTLLSEWFSALHLCWLYQHIHRQGEQDHWHCASCDDVCLLPASEECRHVSASSCCLLLYSLFNHFTSFHKSWIWRYPRQIWWASEYNPFNMPCESCRTYQHEIFALQERIFSLETEMGLNESS